MAKFKHIFTKGVKTVFLNDEGLVKYEKKRLTTTIFITFAISVIAMAYSPAHAEAGILTFVSDLFASNSSAAEPVTTANSQTMQILQAAVNPDPNPSKGGPEIEVLGNSALLAENGPSGANGTNIDSENKPTADTISIYIVRPGDTLSSIAAMFDISSNTIIWANELKTKTIQPGQTLVILPINGAKHIVAKGDTLASIAKKYKGDVDDIISFNNLTANSALTIGTEIIIPEGEGNIDAVPTPAAAKAYAKLPVYDKYFAKPIIGGRKTQGIHGHNGVDFGIPVGTPIYASAGGTVILSRNSGWNGGYGQYIIIVHPNGTQTLYSHLSKNMVVTGTKVEQGQVIGLSGNTGKSTGPHLHFEIRGARNPF